MNRILVGHSVRQVETRIIFDNKPVASATCKAILRVSDNNGWAAVKLQ